ncbi:fungal hydrophobin [Pluteus cervinus]|uniref:Fungal hydrophobin n=1 Tax=Pluteus cervinus TaxID=181527 RepID=A0ACD3AZ02_9AGAR|nr:fungal hydrophobin [Pluteus cervinus]
MFSRIFLALFVALFAFTAYVHANGPVPATTVTLTPTPTNIPIPPNACTADVGTLLCCSNLGSASSIGIGSILGLFGIILTTLDALVGVNCSPLQILGTGGSTCTAQPVCCADVEYNGAIGVGCIPVNVNL